jgi:hypothetical protein
METRETVIIGRVTYNAVRHLILDHKLKPEDQLMLSTMAFEDLLFDYRYCYKTAMPSKVAILGVTVLEDPTLSKYNVTIIRKQCSHDSDENDPLKWVERITWKDFFESRGLM